MQRHRRVQELLEEFELEDLGGRRPYELSGGQRTARGHCPSITAADPKVLLLDEPTRGLDYRLRQSLLYEYLAKSEGGAGCAHRDGDARR